MKLQKFEGFSKKPNLDSRLNESNNQTKKTFFNKQLDILKREFNRLVNEMEKRNSIGVGDVEPVIEQLLILESIDGGFFDADIDPNEQTSIRKATYKRIYGKFKDIIKNSYLNESVNESLKSDKELKEILKDVGLEPHNKKSTSFNDVFQFLDETLDIGNKNKVQIVTSSETLDSLFNQLKENGYSFLVTNTFNLKPNLICVILKIEKA